MKKSKNWLDGCPVMGTHLHILWGTPNRRQSHPRAACRFLGSGTDSVCSHTEFLVANCRSSHEHSARSCHQPYCVGIYSDLTKTNRHHHHHCWSSHGTEKNDCSCLGCDDIQSHRNLLTFHSGLSPHSSRQVNNDGARRIPWIISFVCLFIQLRTAALRLIVQSWLDIPTFATRRLHACHHARAPYGGRWNCGQEMSGNFA